MRGQAGRPGNDRSLSYQFTPGRLGWNLQEGQTTLIYPNRASRARLSGRTMMITNTGPETTVDLSGLPANAKKLGVPEILQSCIGNEISPAIALLKLMFVSRDAAHLQSLIGLVGEAAKSSNQSALAEICSLYNENRSGCRRIMSLSEPPPITRSMTPDARIERLRESFDRWVEEDATLSVALYTF